MKARPLNYRDMRLMGYRIAILRTKSNLTQVVFGKNTVLIDLQLSDGNMACTYQNE